VEPVPRGEENEKQASGNEQVEGDGIGIETPGEGARRPADLGSIGALGEGGRLSAHVGVVAPFEGIDELVEAFIARE
jgi:hypothetical protein